jgi:serine/threonine-protein kinase
VIGDQLGHYRLTGLLGEGGMGRVYAAEDLRLRRRVALKLMPDALCGVPEHVERFQREARLLASVNHPNVITVHSVEEADGRAFITMELVEGETLAQRVRPGGLPLDELLAIAVPLAQALAAAHANGIAHRDLKPANVMLGLDGRLKVVDFGIAKPDRQLAGERTHLTGAGLELGTPAYMAPEQLKGEAIDQRVDLFALGVLLFELATGTRPFAGECDADLVSAILRDAPAPLQRLRPDLPTGLQEIVVACLQKDPSRRGDSAAAIARALGELRAGGSTPQAPAPATRPGISSLAVLPLQEIGGASDDLLADGITEALIADLARASGLKVISRSSVMRFRDSVEPLAEIGARLGVDALVTGSVRRSGSRIRVSVELIEAASERLLWADRYDRELEDVLRLQDEMSHAIADGVHARVKQDERSAAMPRQVNPEVYMLDLKGRSQAELRTAASFRASVSLFRKALSLDPSYGPSWVGLVRAYNLQVNYGMAPAPQLREEMAAALARAREFGADAAEVLGESAHMHWQSDFAWDTAESEFRRALELAPNNGRLWYWRGVALACGGSFPTALDCLDRAGSLDPLSDFIRAARGMVLYWAHRVPESIDCLDKVIEHSPDHAPSYWLRCMSLSAAGEYEAAIASGEVALARMGRIGRTLGYFGFACARAGREAEARAVLAELEKPEDYAPPYFLAMLRHGLGEHEAALSLLERSLAERDSMLRDLRVDRVWDGLREEPRFQALIDALRYPFRSAETRVIEK